MLGHRKELHHNKKLEYVRHHPKRTNSARNSGVYTAYKRELFAWFDPSPVQQQLASTEFVAIPRTLIHANPSWKLKWYMLLTWRLSHPQCHHVTVDLQGVEFVLNAPVRVRFQHRTV